MNVRLDFYGFIRKNGFISEELIDDYVEKNITKENREDLLWLSLNEKANLARKQVNYNKALNDYEQIARLKSLDQDKALLNLLNRIQCLILLNRKPEAIQYLDSYFSNSFSPNNHSMNFECIKCYMEAVTFYQESQKYYNQLYETLNSLKYQGTVNYRSSEGFFQIYDHYKLANQKLSKLLAQPPSDIKRKGLIEFISGNDFHYLNDIASEHIN